MFYYLGSYSRHYVCCYHLGTYSFVSGIIVGELIVRSPSRQGLSWARGASLSPSIYIYIYIHTYTHMYVYLSIHIYTHIHT